MKFLMLLTLNVFASTFNAQVQDLNQTITPSLNNFEVVIGDQIWMKQNLTVKTFRNGDTIPYVQDAKQWEVAGFEEKPAWCYYDNNAANGDTFGIIYNWYAVNDPRGLAPEGWHIPTNEEWKLMLENVNYQEDAIAKYDCCMLKDTSSWKQQNPNYNRKQRKNNPICKTITNSSGFSALPGGMRYYRSYMGKGYQVFWWTATEESFYSSYFYELESDCFPLSSDKALSKDCGLYVRCVKDK